WALLNAVWRHRAGLGVGAWIDLARARHGEELVDDAIVHVTEPRDRPHARDIEHAVDDHRIVDVDSDHLPDHDRRPVGAAVGTDQLDALEIFALHRDR